MNRTARYVNPKTHFALEDYLKRRRGDVGSKAHAPAEDSKKTTVPDVARSR